MQDWEISEHFEEVNETQEDPEEQLIKEVEEDVKKEEKTNDYKIDLE